MVVEFFEVVLGSCRSFLVLVTTNDFVGKFPSTN